MSVKARWMLVAAVLIALGVAAFVMLRPQSNRPATETSPSVVPEPQTPMKGAAAPAPVVEAAPTPRAAPAQESPVFERVLRDADGRRLPLQNRRAEGGLSISGRVVDQRGKPIAGAQVQGRSHLVAGGDMTDAKGQFVVDRLEPGDYEMTAYHESHSRLVDVTVKAGSSGIVLTLPPMATIEGYVVSARDGGPVGDFKIRLEPVPGSSDPGNGKFLRVRDEEGKFTLERVPAGTVALAVSAKGFADAVIPFSPIRAGETRQGLKVHLYTGAVLQGRIVDRAGQGVKLAQVSGGTPRRGTVSDTDGSFRLDSLPPGRFELTVKHESYAPAVVEVSLGGGVNRTQIVLTEGGVLEGEMTLGGVGVPGDVTVRLGAGVTVSAHAEDDGHYRMEGVPNQVLSVEALIDPMRVCGENWIKSVKIDTGHSALQVLDFHFPPHTATVQGTIYTAPQRPFSGDATITAQYEDFALEGPASFIITSRMYGVAEGRFYLCLPGGAIGVVFSIFPGQAQVQDPPILNLNLENGQHVSKDIFLYGRSTLGIRMADGATPIASTVIVVRGKVVAQELSRAFLSTVSVVGEAAFGGGGVATFSGLSSGDYTILVGEYPSLAEVNPVTIPKLLGSAVVSLAQDQELAVSIPLRDK